MNAEKLKRLQAQVRIGGKGTPRRKKKIIHQTAVTDDKKLQSSLKKLSVSTIPGIEEVNIIKDDLTVIHFNNPKAQASLSANTFAVTGHGEHKKIVEMLPEILPQLGQETVVQLRMFANSMSQGAGQQNKSSNLADNLLSSVLEEDDDVPMLVSDFDEVAKLEAEKQTVLVTEPPKVHQNTTDVPSTKEPEKPKKPKKQEKLDKQEKPEKIEKVEKPEKSNKKQQQQQQKQQQKQQQEQKQQQQPHKQQQQPQPQQQQQPPKQQQPQQQQQQQQKQSNIKVKNKQMADNENKQESVDTPKANKVLLKQTKENSKVGVVADKTPVANSANILMSENNKNSKGTVEEFSEKSAVKETIVEQKSTAPITTVALKPDTRLEKKEIMDNKKIILPTTQLQESPKPIQPEDSKILQVSPTESKKGESTQISKASKDSQSSPKIVKTPQKQETTNIQQTAKPAQIPQIPQAQEAKKTPSKEEIIPSPKISDSQKIPLIPPTPQTVPTSQIQTTISQAPPIISSTQVIGSQVQEMPSIEEKIATTIPKEFTETSQMTQAVQNKGIQIKKDSQSVPTIIDSKASEKTPTSEKSSTSEPLKTEQIPQISETLQTTKIDITPQSAQNQQIKATPVVSTTLEITQTSKKIIEEPIKSEQIPQSTTTPPTSTVVPLPTVTPISADTKENKQGKKSKKEAKSQKKEQPIGPKEANKKDIDVKSTTEKIPNEPSKLTSKESENVKIVKDEPKIEIEQNIITQEKQSAEKSPTTVDILKGSTTPEKTNKNASVSPNKKSITPEISNKTAQNDKKVTNTGKKDTTENQERSTEKLIVENLTENKTQNNKKVTDSGKTEITGKQEKPAEKIIAENVTENKPQQEPSASVENAKNQPIIEKEVNKDKVTPVGGAQKKGTPTKKTTSTNPEPKATTKTPVKVETKKQDNKPKQTSPAKANPAPSTKPTTKSPSKSSTPTKSPEKQVKSSPVATQQKTTESNNSATSSKSTGSKQPSPPNKQVKAYTAPTTNTPKPS